MEYVDLGLSVKWADCNVGASFPEESGKYFNYIDAIKLKDIKIPTYEQWRELQDNCDCKLDKKKVGYIIIGKNGNSIYLPIAGEGNNNKDARVMGAFLWSSTPANVVGINYAYFASFTIRKTKSLDLLDQSRYYLSVRGVQ